MYKLVSVLHATLIRRSQVRGTVRVCYRQPCRGMSTGPQRPAALRYLQCAGSAAHSKAEGTHTMDELQVLPWALRVDDQRSPFTDGDETGSCDQRIACCGRLRRIQASDYVHVDLSHHTQQAWRQAHHILVPVWVVTIWASCPSSLSISHDTCRTQIAMRFEALAAL